MSPVLYLQSSTSISYSSTLPASLQSRQGCSFHYSSCSSSLPVVAAPAPAPSCSDVLDPSAPHSHPDPLHALQQSPVRYQMRYLVMYLGPHPLQYSPWYLPHCPPLMPAYNNKLEKSYNIHGNPPKLTYKLCYHYSQAMYPPAQKASPSPLSAQSPSQHR